MGAIALGVIGAGLGIAGTAMGASSANKKYKELSQATGSWLPDIPRYQEDYFADLNRYFKPSADLARRTGTEAQDLAMNLRERALPGFKQGMQDAFSSISPLLRGELPKGVMDAFTRAGGASTVGLGMGGSGFGALNTGLFGARGALGGMQTGHSLLQSLMDAMPQVNVPSVMDFLSQGVMNPMQRTQTQLNVRGQNLGIASQLAGMDRGKDVWGGFLSNMGGTLMGGAMGGMGGMGGGGGMQKGPSQVSYGGGFSPHVAPQAAPNYSFGLY